jgi:hypothetical protein
MGNSPRKAEGVIETANQVPIGISEIDLQALQVSFAKLAESRDGTVSSRACLAFFYASCPHLSLDKILSKLFPLSQAPVTFNAWCNAFTCVCTERNRLSTYFRWLADEEDPVTHNPLLSKLAFVDLLKTCWWFSSHLLTLADQNTGEL